MWAPNVEPADYPRRYCARTVFHNDRYSRFCWHINRFFSLLVSRHPHFRLQLTIYNIREYNFVYEISFDDTFGSYARFMSAANLVLGFSPGRFRETRHGRAIPSHELIILYTGRFSFYLPYVSVQNKKVP